jgi:UDP-glucose 4-epimerase
MKVLVTGGAGFIGSHLCERLVSLGFHVRCFDNFSKGSLKNIEGLMNHAGFELFKGDLLNFEEVSKAVHDVDVVYHLAAVVGVKHYVENPLKVIRENVFGTHNILEACWKEEVQRFVFASTSEVYGKNTSVPLREEDERVLGSTSIDRWCYSTSKALDEHACLAFHRLHGLKTVVLRYFNVYGPKQECSEYGGVISIFIRRVLNNEPPQVLGDGQQTRAFTYVDDIVDGTIRAAQEKNAVGEIFNLGSEREISILGLAELVIELAGKKKHIKPVFVSYEDFYGASYEDVRRRVPDISKAKRVLGFEPKVSLEDGLRKTIEWYRRHPELIGKL